MKKYYLFCIAILLLVSFSYSFVGCGGSGGGDEGGGFVDTNQPLALNSNNAVAVSGLVVDATGGGMTAGSLGENVIASINSTSGGGSKFDIFIVSQAVMDVVWTMQHEGTLTGPSVVAGQVPSSVDCSVSGRVRATWNDSDPQDNLLSDGDSIILNFESCVEDDVTLNGELMVGVLEVVNDPETDPSWKVVLRLNFNTLTASSSGDTVNVSGTLDVAVEQLLSGEYIIEATTEVDTGSGTTASSVINFWDNEDFIELTLFSVSLQENPDGSFKLSSQGTLESSFIGGIVTFQTTSDVTGDDFDNSDPSTGEMIITGAANSKILLRILSSLDVELDVDDDGDGAIDDTIPTSWDEMRNAADAL